MFEKVIHRFIKEDKRKIMDKRRSRDYDKNNSKKNEDEVVKMLTIPLTKSVPTKTVEKKVVENPRKKRSALEISNSIGVHGAFGRTLSDLHKQGNRYGLYYWWGSN
ncbi:hypothetical protein [Bacillus carboniphilus]